MPKLPKYPELGRRLRQLARDAHINQPTLARLADLSGSYPSKLLAGLSRPSPEVLRALATVLHADYEELATLAGYDENLEDDHPYIDGWSLLDDDAKGTVFQLAEFLVRRARGESGALRRPGARSSSSNREADGQ